MNPIIATMGTSARIKLGCRTVLFSFAIDLYLSLIKYLVCRNAADRLPPGQTGYTRTRGGALLRRGPAGK